MASQSNKPEQRFLSGLTHELRTPLGSILMLTELLGENRAGNLGPKDLGYVQKIRQAASDVRGLIEEVGLLNRIDDGRIAPVLTEVSPGDLVDPIVQDYRPVAESRQLRLVTSQTLDRLDKVTTDRGLVQRILDTLLTNAIRTTPQGDVALDLTQADNQLTVRVTDGAEPVPDAQHQAVFEPFAYTGPQTRRRLGGQSLALPIARRLSHLLGGELKLIGAAEGNTLVLTLPIEGRE
ncbi:MAG: HAMP domain-containing sensor histidine kinase [Acidobacteriota bacterium]